MTISKPQIKNRVVFPDIDQCENVTGFILNASFDRLTFSLGGHILNKSLYSFANFFFFFSGLDPRAPLPPGVSMLPTQKQRVPPPPGEDNREVDRQFFLFRSFMCSMLGSQ